MINPKYRQKLNPVEEINELHHTARLIINSKTGVRNYEKIRQNTIGKTNHIAIIYNSISHAIDMSFDPPLF